MVIVRAIGGNTKCIVCNASFTSANGFALIDSKRGKVDLKELVYNVVGLKPINGVLCRHTCQKKLETLERKIKLFTTTISQYTYEVNPVMFIVCSIKKDYF